MPKTTTKSKAKAKKKPAKATQTKPRFDVISIGDATLDHFMQIDDVIIDCSHSGAKKGTCMLCLRFADKIAVESLKKVIGGNAANHAVGAARLGYKPAYCTILGDDDTGLRIAQMLKKEKVSTKYISHAKGEETNFSVVLNHESERTILVYHVHRDYKLPKLEKSRWIYYTSAGPGHEVMNKPLVEHVKKHNIKLGYNPGTHQLKSGLEEMAQVIAVTETIFINKEEAQQIVGDFNSFKRLLKELHKLGVKTPLVTDGPNGAYAFDGHSYYKIATTPTKVIERTGAGDSFAAAFVGARMAGKDIATALRWGTMNSASVIQFIGPEEGLLTQSGIKKWLKKYSSLKAKTF